MSRASPAPFQSQARFFGALSPGLADDDHTQYHVSIAGAILWGFEPALEQQAMMVLLFQSQARFFGALSDPVR